MLRFPFCLLLVALSMTPLRALAADDPPPGFTWLPGGARVIPRTSSASRDTPVLEYAYGPRAQGSLGGELGFLEQRWTLAALRLGMYGMITLENDQETIVFPREYWRGHAGFSLTVASEALGRQFFGPGGAVEFGIVIGHESDHKTDAPNPLDTFEYSLYGQMNFLTHDIAAKVAMGAVGEVRARISEKLLAGSAYTHSPSFDLELRFYALPWLEPLVAVFGEHLFAGADSRDCYFARALAGIAFAGRFGELTPFASVDAGCGKGLLYERREGHVSGGFRYAPF